MRVSHKKLYKKHFKQTESYLQIYTLVFKTSMSSEDNKKKKTPKGPPLYDFRKVKVVLYSLFNQK